MNSTIAARVVKNNPLGIQTVMHIGACKGEELAFYEDIGVESVIWVEANTHLCSGALQENLDKAVNVKNNYLINRAVTDKDEDVVTLNIIADVQKSNEGASSILQPTKHLELYPHLNVCNTLQVKTITIDTIVKQVGKPIDFIALDIQGCELLALKGAHDTLNSSHLKTVLIEIATEPLYEGACIVTDIDEYLWKKHKFIRLDTVMMHRVWGDALYVKQ